MGSSESKSNAAHVSRSDLSEGAQSLEDPVSKGSGPTNAAETQDVVPLSQSQKKAEEKVFELSPSRASARLNITGDGSQATVKVYHRNDDGTEPLPAESLFSSAAGRKRLLVKLHSNSCVLRLDWEEGELVGVRVNGVFPSEPGTPATRRRRVFTVQKTPRGSDLGIEANMVAAKAVFSESGAPELLKVEASGPAGKLEPSNDKATISIDWRDGALMGVRVQGRIEGPVESERTQIRRTFNVRHRKNDILLALDTSEGPPVLDYVGALDKVRVETVGALDKVRVETVNAVREEILNAASGIVAATWGGRTPSERVNAALPLVLIAQVQRSGGTLLSQLFDGHPEVWAFPHELKWGGDPKYRWPKVDPRTEGPLRIARSLVAGNFGDSRGFNLFGYQKEGTSTRDQRLPFNWSQWAYVEAFLDSWEAKPPESRRQCLDIFMSAYFSAFLDWRRSGESQKIVTAFTPRVNFIKSYPENTAFFDDYPDGMMISICRHPGDWYASASRHEVMYEEPAQGMLYWRESVEGSLQLKKRYPDQVMLVPLAGLVADPSGVMRQISQRLGLTWSPTLVVPTFNGMPIASNSSFNPVVGIDTSAVGRRDLLPADVRKRIEADNLALYEKFLAAADVT